MHIACKPQSSITTVPVSFRGPHLILKGELLRYLTVTGVATPSWTNNLLPQLHAFTLTCNTKLALNRHDPKNQARIWVNWCLPIKEMNVLRNPSEGHPVQ